LQIDSELRSSSKTLCGTPVKMLIAQEMPNETESKKMPPNVVARLIRRNIKIYMRFRIGRPKPIWSRIPSKPKSPP